MDILQLLVSGIANGCIYGLLALGFVLIYKASEAVNFAQGDMMMLGAFLGITFINASHADLPFLRAQGRPIITVVATAKQMGWDDVKFLVSQAGFHTAVAADPAKPPIGFTRC